MASPPRNQLAGLSLATSANGTTRSGATLSMDFTAPGGLLVLVRSEITTTSVAATFTLQVSTDNSTWRCARFAQATSCARRGSTAARPR